MLKKLKSGVDKDAQGCYGKYIGGGSAPPAPRQLNNTL